MPVVCVQRQGEGVASSSPLIHALVVLTHGAGEPADLARMGYEETLVDDRLLSKCRADVGNFDIFLFLHLFCVCFAFY